MRESTTRPRRRRGWTMLGLIGVAVWALSCSEEAPTGLGSDSRIPPDPLQSVALSTTLADTVFPVPVSLGASPVGQVGRQVEYTAHVLYALSLPTLQFTGDDTLRLNAANLSIALDSVVVAPFEGRMGIGLREVAPEERGWHPDSILTALPTLLESAIAADSVLDGASLTTAARSLFFELNLSNFTDFDSVSSRGDTLHVNVALVFLGFETGGPGFIEFSRKDSAGKSRTPFNAFYDSPDNESTLSLIPERQLTVVEFDTTFTRAGKLVASDGYRRHSYLKFALPNSVLPESAIVYKAELVLTQVTDEDGTSFGTGLEIGVIVPSDTTLIYSEEQNTRNFSFRTTLIPVPGGNVTIPISAYIVDLQEGSVANRGMILRLSNEGTKVRHFEFYGSADPDSVRPRIRIIYGMPAFSTGEGS